ncbi:DUF6879 family protein [Streptomyces siamensis]|uniref:DUF6879 domain-containing protein n=1 Tax=Streptomyces siamensis TaxID=1274986 RepID=A0ABP9IIY8_9ACTN
MDGSSGASTPASGSSSAEGLRIPPVLLKTLVTAIVATIAYVITNLIDQEQDKLWQIAVSVVIGGATLIVQYMIEFERRLTQVVGGQRTHADDVVDRLTAHHGEMQTLVDQKFADISEATELFCELDRSVLRSDGVPRLARSATRVTSLGHGLVSDFAHEEIERLASMMENLTSLSTDCPGENHDWLMALTKCAKVTMDATSSFVERDYWNSEPALRYLQAQADAMQQRGMSIRRLFIVQRPEHVDNDLRRLCESQSDIGIETRVVTVSELPLRVRRGTTNDFVIFDDELCYEVEPDLLQMNAKTTLNAREDHVRQRIKRFAELWDVGEGVAGNSAATTGA